MRALLSLLLIMTIAGLGAAVLADRIGYPLPWSELNGAERARALVEALTLQSAR